MCGRHCAKHFSDSSVPPALDRHSHGNKSKHALSAHCVQLRYVLSSFLDLEPEADGSEAVCPTSQAAEWRTSLGAVLSDYRATFLLVAQHCSQE
jgi:hypothetical protein